METDTETRTCRKCLYYIREYHEILRHAPNRHGFECRKHGIQIEQIGGDILTSYVCAQYEPASEPTSQELRQEAAHLDQEVQDSFDRCDTDGFLSQWALGLTAQLKRRQAEIQDAGNVAEFPALFNLDGVRVRAKLIYVKDHFRPYGGTKPVWMFCDKFENSAHKFVNAFYKRPATLEKKGYREGREIAPAQAKVVGTGYGLSGSAWVATVRTDKGYPDDAVEVA